MEELFRVIIEKGDCPIKVMIPIYCYTLILTASGVHRLDSNAIEFGETCH